MKTTVADKLVRLYQEDAEWLENVRRALVMESSGANVSLAAAFHAVRLAAEPPGKWPRWPKPESNPQH